MTMSHALWQGIFGNPHPVEVEIGAGTGTFLLSAAAGRRTVNYFGIENARRRAAELEDAVAARRLGNVRVLAGDAACIVAHLVPPASVAAYHVYFPDPWWKRRHHRRRLFTSTFVRDLARTLVPGGTLYVATDVPVVLDLVLETVAVVPEFVHAPGRRSPRTGMTHFERKGLARGAAILEAAFVTPPTRGADQVSRAAPMTPAESPS